LFNLFEGYAAPSSALFQATPTIFTATRLMPSQAFAAFRFPSFLQNVGRMLAKSIPLRFMASMRTSQTALPAN